MKRRADSYSHPPLDPGLRDPLSEKSECLGPPVVAESRNPRLKAEIAAFASKHAGSDLDLDDDLERAGIEALLDGT